MAPLQFVRVIRNGELERFAFGEDSETGEKHDERCVYPEECLVLSKLRENIADEEFGYRYKVLWDGIAAFLQPSDLSNADSIYVYLVQTDRGPLFAGVRYRSEGSSGLESGGLALQFYLPLDTPYGKNFPWPGVGRAYDIPESHTSSMLELAKLWLHECTSGTGKHVNCPSSIEMPPLPPRVIDVGSSCADAYLYLPSPGERGRYVALSHCWGGVSPLITTLSCFDKFRVAFPQPIPQTFADAMDVTRRLGYKYLWIDSLCIIQDCATDWGKHATRMNYIYSQAHFTISADGAQDSLAGFLHPQNKRRETIAIQCKTFTTNPLREERTHIVHVRQRGPLAYQLPYHDFFPGYPWKRNSSASVLYSLPADSPQVWDPNFRTMRSKLSTRAWAFQERLLSPRTLHFAPSEMAWECRSICSCECSATNEPRTILARSLLKGSKALNLAPVDKKGPQSAYNIEAAWRRDIVEEFTRLHLTRPNDRLPALAGLAARAAKSRPGDQYMAGVWRKSLTADLLWHTTGERASCRMARDNMPTWSWASVTGEVHYPLQRYSLAWYNRRDPEPSTLPLMRVLRTQYTANPKSVFASGPRLPASITLWGYLLKVKGFRRVSSYQYEIRWPAGVNLHPNTVVAADVHCGNSTNGDACTGETSSCDNISEALSKQRDLFVLVGYIDKGEVFGLLLARCPSRRSVIPSFERIGCVNGTFNERQTFLERRSNGIVDFGPTDEWADQKVTSSKFASFLSGRGKSLLKIW